MPKSPYYWNREEERKLIDLWNKGERNARILAAQLDRKPEAVRKKLQRLGFVVGQTDISSRTTTNEEAGRRRHFDSKETRIRLKIPDELPTVEEALKVMAAALDALSKPGLDKIEIMRFKTIVGMVKTYQGLFAEYVQFRELEVKMVDYEHKYAELVKDRRARCAWSGAVDNAIRGHSLSTTGNVHGQKGFLSEEHGRARGTRLRS